MEQIAYWRGGAAGRGAELRRRFGGVSPYVLDTLLAGFSAAVSFWSVYNDEVARPWWVYALALGTALPLPWRRRAPLSVAAACGLVSVGVSVAAHSSMPQIPVYAVLTIHTVADRGRDWQRMLLLVILLVSNVVGTHSVNGMLFSLMLTIGTFVFGSLVRELRGLARVEAERAHEVGLRAASDAARAVAEERGRIAREMHDILAHAVALMVIQAEAGPVVVRSDPDRAVKAFDTIADSGRDAMVQLRRVLGVLKEEGAGPQLAPQPRLTELAAVAERVREAGVRVELELPGPGRAMPGDVEATAFRIVQEALTNVVKHSGADSSAVRIVRAGEVLEVAVSDNGRGVRPRADRVVSDWSGGRGLVGIRERAAACGGRAEAGPRPDGTGFLVSARLPLGAAVL